MKKLFRILLSLVFVLLLIPALGKTAHAETTLDSSSTTWDEDCAIGNESDITIDGGVTVSNNIKLTIPAGRTLTVNGGINADGWTLTVEGAGKLVVNGTSGGNGGDGSNGDPGGNGFTVKPRCQWR